jgi:hypothetical protein
VDHTLLHGGTHTRETTVVGEGVVITESVLLGSAELGGNGVSGDTANIRGRVGDHHSVLNVQTLDLAKSAGVSAVLGDEPSDNSHLGVGVDDLVRAEEAPVAHAVGVEVTAVGVAGAAAVIAFAHQPSGVVAGVGSQRGRDAVGLPDIQLGAAGAVVAHARVAVIVRGLPASDVTLFHH